MGKYILSTELPWYYLFVCIGITTPLLHLAGFFAGVVHQGKDAAAIIRKKAAMTERGWFRIALLLNLAILSSLLGLVAIYSATFSYQSNKYVIVQSVALVLGIFCFVAASLIDLENIARFWKFFFVFNILFQLSLFVLGTAGDTGNRSWIRFGGIGIQPAEFGKIPVPHRRKGSAV